jgi:two-component system, NarL family, invasion response regulator UvrY
MPVVRVLVVDDHESFRRTAAAVVEAADGFVVAGSAASGEEAVAVAAAIRPDLVLMDVHMPGMDGLTATRRLCTLPHPPAVVLLSTMDAEELGDLGGAVAYLAKAEFGTGSLAAAWARTAPGG